MPSRMHRLAACIALAMVIMVFCEEISASRGDHLARDALQKILEELAEKMDSNAEKYEHHEAEEMQGYEVPLSTDDPEPDDSPGWEQLLARLMHEYSLNTDSSDAQSPAQSQSSCIQSFKIDAQTGNVYGGGFNKYYNANYQSHYLKLTKKDSSTAKASLPSPADQGQPYVHTILWSVFDDSGSCLQPTDITKVQLVAGGTDGWFISEITISFQTNSGEEKILTRDIPFDKWVDSDEHNGQIQDLSLIPQTDDNIDRPQCGYGIPVCECKESASICIFFLEVDEIMTFTSYQQFAVGLDEGLAVRGTQGVLFNIDEDTGEAGPHPFYASRKCADEQNKPMCTDPQYVDGKTYRMAVGVNGQIPGPTLIVHEDQTVIIHVHNNMSSEGISIHWHGMHQIGSPWMDGVGQVTQCQIGPSTSYSYQYVAKPAGTFWYHSHSGAQRTDGFFGTLIVKENSMTDIEAALISQGVGSFQDVPELHSITLLDWQHETSLDTFSQLNAGLGFYPDVPVGEIPDDCDKRYDSTRSIERAEVGPVPYFSGLINGKGRHNDVPYSKTRLSVFPVEKGQRYRFRLIGAQGLYAYKFSIDGHRLTVVGTDGYWMKPEKNVDFIIIHTGERYDFILEADQDTKNYWMRAETLEINPKGGPPYQSLGHVAEGILQYVPNGGDITKPPAIKSTEYEEIKLSSPPIVCSSSHQCSAINCPFENYHPNYHITCTNVGELELLLDTRDEEMPAPYPSSGSNCPDNNCLHFINFNFEGDSETSSVNGRNFLLPPVPPQTQPVEFSEQANRCDLTAECNPISTACMCTHMIDIPYDKTVQFVLTALGAYDNAHPIHLHGHSFHVVKVGYPSYDSNTGFIQQAIGPDCDNDPSDHTVYSVHNPDIECHDSCGGSQCPTADGCNPNRCTKPGWKNDQSPSLTINKRTIRKDTVMVPAGGYVVINFKSDNPGHWFLHCHIEVHQLEGMALIVNEAKEKQQEFKLPEGLNKCGDFSISTNQYKQLLLTSQSLLNAGRSKVIYH